MRIGKMETQKGKYFSKISEFFPTKIRIEQVFSYFLLKIME